MILLVQLRIYTTMIFENCAKLQWPNGSCNFDTIFKYQSWCKSFGVIYFLLVWMVKSSLESTTLFGATMQSKWFSFK